MDMGRGGWQPALGPMKRTSALLKHCSEQGLCGIWLGMLVLTVVVLIIPATQHQKACSGCRESSIHSQVFRSGDLAQSDQSRADAAPQPHRRWHVVRPHRQPRPASRSLLSGNSLLERLAVALAISGRGTNSF